MLTTIAIIVGVLVAGLIAVAASRPDQFRVERRTTIAAPADRIFSLIDDFHQWAGWSPWEKLDPRMTRTFSGAERGRGAAYAWQGNPKVGQGRMEILEVQSPVRVVIKLDFLKPFEAHNTAEFVLTPSPSTTEVMWAVYGPSPFMSKVFGMFVNMDTLLGRDFEKGLAGLKTIAEVP